jgi:hypothetical protein
MAARYQAGGVACLPDTDLSNSSCRLVLHGITNPTSATDGREPAHAGGCVYKFARGMAGKCPAPWRGKATVSARPGF